MDLELHGKRAFVSGGTSGIGRRIAVELGHEGCNIVIHGRNAARSEAVARRSEALLA